jgi:hypothetical protein
MQIIDGIPVWGDPVDEGSLTPIKNCARDAEDRISPAAVGCGEEVASPPAAEWIRAT